MKKLTVLMMSILLVVCAITITAQDELPEGAGEGGTIVIAGEVPLGTFNPLFAGDITSWDVVNRIYPHLFGTDPFRGVHSPGFKGSLATGWEYDETGTVLTMTLRQDAFWSDGVQITAQDYIWVADVLRSGLLASSQSHFMFAQLDDGTEGNGPVVDVVALDDFTLQFRFAQPDCNHMISIFNSVLPSHRFQADYGDDILAMNDDPYYLPGVYWGAWKDPVLDEDHNRVILTANQDYPDTELGYVSPGHLIILFDVEDPLELFRAGELTLFTGVLASEFIGDPNYQGYAYNAENYYYVGFNLADPDRPQAAYDQDGNYIRQDPHPILADVRVRQAMAYAVDMDTIIEEYFDGPATHISIPTTPAYPDWDPELTIPYDPVRAANLLEEAGWWLEGDNPYRICGGCETTLINPDYEGTEMTLTWTLPVNASESDRQLAEFMAQSWRDLGIHVLVEYLGFRSEFRLKLYNQAYDLIFLAWSLGLPPMMENRDILGVQADRPGGGLNFGSYHNFDLDQLYRDSIDPALTGGCSLEGRLQYIRRANRILNEELPYIFLWSNINYVVTHSWVQNWNPAPFNRTWNEDAWIVIPPEEE